MIKEWYKVQNEPNIYYKKILQIIMNYLVLSMLKTKNIDYIL